MTAVFAFGGMALALVAATLLVHSLERRLAARPRPPLAVRVSLVLFVVYVPFAWLVWFQDDEGYRRGLLGIAPLMPGIVPTQIVSALVARRPPPSPWGWIAAGGVVVAAFMLAVGIMRRGWRWMIVTAIVLGALTGVGSAITLQLVRM